MTHQDTASDPAHRTSSCSQPLAMAAFLDVIAHQAARRPILRVLEVGAGTGFHAALIAELTAPMLLERVHRAGRLVAPAPIALEGVVDPERLAEFLLRQDGERSRPTVRLRNAQRWASEIRDDALSTNAFQNSRASPGFISTMLGVCPVDTTAAASFAAR